jgi:hypothetical protein
LQPFGLIIIKNIIDVITTNNVLYNSSANSLCPIIVRMFIAINTNAVLIRMDFVYFIFILNIISHEQKKACPMLPKKNSAPPARNKAAPTASPSGMPGVANAPNTAIIPPQP